MRSKKRIIDLFKNRIFKNMSDNIIEFHFLFLRKRNVFASNFLKADGPVLNTLDLNVIQ